MRPFIAIAVVVSSFLLAGCDQSTRQLTGGYALLRFQENGQFYVVPSDDKSSSGGGIFDGTIDRIGWNADWILAKVNKVYTGDASGWYALNLTTRRISGPYLEAEVRSHSILSKIGVRRCSDLF